MARRRREPETARIEAMAHDGRGIAALAGKKIFVAGALEGELVRLKRRKRRRNYDEAELLEVLEPAAGRIDPRCAAFGRCGGCSLQHVAAAEQRAIKLSALKDSLARLGGVAPDRWLDPVHDDGPDGPWAYRRRARLAVKDVAAKGRVLVGFREAHAPFVCDMHRCEVLCPPVGDLIDPLSELIGSLTIRRRLPQVEVAVGDDRTMLVFRTLDEPSTEDLAALDAFGAAHGVAIALQPGGTDSVVARDGPAVVRYALPEFAVEIEFGPTDFVQVNGKVNRLMVSRAVELLDVEPGHRVLDLFCGIGNFSLPLARRAAHVLGAELEPFQVERARANARRNGIDNCEFRCADLALAPLPGALGDGHWDRVLLDPARSGAREVVDALPATGATRVVYVSCHPGTLARDAGMLVRQHGYRFEAAGIIDMFPHTRHVESLAVFQKDQ